MFVFFPRPIVDLRDRFYATCHPGLEEVVAAELSSPLIGAIDVAPGASGVSFAGDARVGYLANVWLRSAIRVLVEMRRGWLDPSAPGGAAVYDFVKGAAPWEDVVPGGVGARDPDPVSKSRSKSNVASSTSTSIASSILFLPEAGDAGASRGASANDAFVAVVRAGHSRGGDCSGDVLRRPGNVAVPGCGSSVVVIASPRARRMWIFQITRCARF